MSSAVRPPRAHGRAAAAFQRPFLMQQHDIERIIRGLLDDLAVNLTLALVERSSAGWRVVLKGAPRPLDVTVPDGPPAALRALLKQRIEAESR